MHKTKFYGDIGIGKVISDLYCKGISVSIPISEHLPYDLVADINGRLVKIQVKFSSTGVIKMDGTFLTTKGNNYHRYGLKDFDYFGLYYAPKDVVLYPSITFGGYTIRSSLPKNGNQFYWYKDFLFFTDDATRWTRKAFIERYGRVPELG